MLLALLPLTACGVSSKPIEGRVVDTETKKPIAGAIVIARWDGTYSALVDSHTVCYHVETATTDQDGRYKIPGWWEKPKGPFFGEGPMYLDAYKPGYEKYWPAGYDRTEDFKNNVLYLAPFKGTKEERLKYLGRQITGTRCSAAGDKYKNLYPMYRAIYEESKSVSKSYMEIVWFRRQAAEAAVATGDHVSGDEMEKRVDEFLKDNLQ